MTHRTRLLCDLLWILAVVVYVCFWVFQLRGIAAPVTAQENCGISGHLITVGKLTTNANFPHIFEVNGLTIATHPDGIPVIILERYHGKRVAILIREVQ